MRLLTSFHFLRQAAFTLLFACLLPLALEAQAQAQEKKAKPGKRSQDPLVNAFANPVDNPKLPRVLIIGDSISIAYTPKVRKLLWDKVNVHRVKTNCQWSAIGATKIEEWVGDSKWDAIHFNFGLWDWYGWAQKEKATPESYRKSLTESVTKLKKTNAKLIFGLTTPPCIGPENKVKITVPVALAEKYNTVAKEVMKEHGVAINDLYSVIGDQREKYQKGKNDVHYTVEGSQLLANQVAKKLSEQLAK